MGRLGGRGALRVGGMVVALGAAGVCAVPPVAAGECASVTACAQVVGSVQPARTAALAEACVDGYEALWASETVTSDIVSSMGRAVPRVLPPGAVATSGSEAGLWFCLVDNARVSIQAALRYPLHGDAPQRAGDLSRSRAQSGPGRPASGAPVSEGTVLTISYVAN